MANALRDAELDLEDAPSTLAALAGDAEIRRVYALGNRFSRLRRVLEDAGFERVAVEGSPASLRMQIAMDAIDLGHQRPDAAFLIAAEGEEMQLVIDRLLAENRAVSQLGADAVAAAVSEADSAPAPRDDEPRQRPRHRRNDEPEEEQPEAPATDEEEDDDREEDEEEVTERSAAPARRERPSPARERDRPRKAPKPDRAGLDDPWDLLLTAIERIVQGPPQLVFESVVRQEILEMEPAFNERDAGFGSFTEYFEEAREKGLIQIEREPSTGTYLVVGARLPEGS